MFGPELFLVRLSDDGMAPRLRAVDFAYVDPDEPAVDGCLVAVWDPAPRPRDAAGWAGTARSLRAAYPGFTASRAPWWALTRLGRRTGRPRARQRARRMKRPGLRWDASPGRWDGSGGGGARRWVGWIQGSERAARSGGTASGVSVRSSRYLAVHARRNACISRSFSRESALIRRFVPARPNGYRQGVADGGTAARIGTLAFCWTADMRLGKNPLINNEL